VIFALQFAKPVEEVPDISELMVYDPVLMMNVFKKDGALVIEDHETLMKYGSTTSTAGSKTHFDD
jgi:putative ATP-grasp target RiPP